MKTEYELELEWDVKDAKYYYVLRSNAFTNSHTHEKFWGQLATGDIRWAKRTAKHYGLELPSIPDKEIDELE